MTNLTPGDLVVHDGKPVNLRVDERFLIGIFIGPNTRYENFYNIFWYTTGKIQSVHATCVKKYEDK